MTASAMSLPVLPTITAGSTITAEQMNQMSYACAFLMAKPMTRVYDSTGGQSLPTEPGASQETSAANYTAINFNNKDFDVDGAWPGSGNQLIIQTSGWYKIRYSINVNIGGNGPCNAAVVSTSGTNNPSGSGVTSRLCMGSFGYSNSIAYLGSSGIFPLFLYGAGYGSGTGDNIQLLCMSSGDDAGAVTSISSISGGITATLNPGSSLSIEWVSAG